MGKLPERLKIAGWYRSQYQSIEPKIRLPRINPSIYQVLAIVLSFAFVLNSIVWVRFALGLMIVLSDWLDGATARRYGVAGEMGYMIDVAVDRLSELIMFFPLVSGPWSVLWFGLAVINLMLSFLSFKTEKHMILPLRFAYLFFLWI